MIRKTFKSEIIQIDWVELKPTGIYTYIQIYLPKYTSKICKFFFKDNLILYYNLGNNSYRNKSTYQANYNTRLMQKCEIENI